MAQVYSVNIVGYVNYDVPKKPTGPSTLVLMNNPLRAATNTLQGVLPNVPDFSQVFKFSGGGYQGPFTFLFGSWDSPDIPLNPGEGFFLVLDNSVVAGTTTVTFVGEVNTGPSNSVATTLAVPAGAAGPLGISLLGSKIPQGGNLVTQLLFPVADFDQVFLWNKATFGFVGPFTALGGDFDTPVNLGVGDAFFLIPDTATGPRSWSRNFQP
jgi:hypothetical protein